MARKEALTRGGATIEPLQQLPPQEENNNDREEGEEDEVVHRFCCQAASRLVPYARSSATDGGTGSSQQGDPTHTALRRQVHRSVSAAFRVGHRTCVALWGPQGNGKRALLTAVAESLRNESMQLVMELDGDTVSSDEDGVRSIVWELQRFLQRSTSAPLRNRNAAFRDRSFPLAVLFRMEGSADTSASIPTTTTTTTPQVNITSSSTTARSTATGIHAKQRWSDSSAVTESVVAPRPFSAADEDSTTHAWGSSSLPPLLRPPAQATGMLSQLQDCLQTVSREGVHLAVCVHNISRFGLWCDRLMYVLSGLMHEVEERRGGMAIVVTTTTPDLRSTEKRLSSRLTSEMVFVPASTMGLTDWIQKGVQETTSALSESVSSLEAQLRKVRRKADQEVLQRQIAEERKPLAVGEALCRAFSQTTPSTSNSGGVETRRSKQHQQSSSSSTSSDADTAVVGPPPCGSWWSHAVRRSHLQLYACGAPSVVVLQHAVALLQNTHCLSDLLRSSTSAATTAIVSGSSAAKKRPRSDVAVPPEVSLTPNVASSSSYSPSSNRRLVAHHLTAGALIPWGAPTDGGDVDVLSEDAWLVRYGYLQKEGLQLLVYAAVRAEKGIARTLEELVADVGSSLGTKAVQQMNWSRYTDALEILRRLRVVALGSGRRVVQLCGSVDRVLSFLRMIFQDSTLWEQQLGLSIGERQHLALLVG